MRRYFGYRVEDFRDGKFKSKMSSVIFLVLILGGSGSRFVAFATGLRDGKTRQQTHKPVAVRFFLIRS